MKSAGSDPVCELFFEMLSDTEAFNAVSKCTLYLVSIITTCTLYFNHTCSALFYIPSLTSALLNPLPYFCLPPYFTPPSLLHPSLPSIPPSRPFPFLFLHTFSLFRWHINTSVGSFKLPYTYIGNFSAVKYFVCQIFAWLYFHRCDHSTI